MNTCLDIEPDHTVLIWSRRAVGITRQSRGVCGQALEPRAGWEGPAGKAAAANRTREIRLSGMRGGLTETWSMAELGTHGVIERAPIGHSSPTDARAVFLPDCSGRQGHVLASESLAMSIARFGHVAMPQLEVGNPSFIARCKGLSCPDVSQRWA